MTRTISYWEVAILSNNTGTVLSIKQFVCVCVCVWCDAADGESGGNMVPVEPVGGNAFCYFLLPGHQASHKLNFSPLVQHCWWTQLSFMFTNKTFKRGVCLHIPSYTTKKIKLQKFKLVLGNCLTWFLQARQPWVTGAHCKFANGLLWQICQSRPNLFYSDSLITRFKRV